MGLWDRIAGEFIDVIEWIDEEPDSQLLMYRFPTTNREIQMNSSLVVRESQCALFVYQGEMADLFKPGHYKLSTDNMPVMTTLQHWTHGFNSPFKSDIYFFNLRRFTDLRWGTPNPVTVRDPDIGVIRARAFGSYTLRIADPVKLYQELAGAVERYTVADIESQLRAEIVTRLSDFIAESAVSFIDYAANLNEFSAALNEVMNRAAAGYGLQIDRFVIQNISVPAEVEKIIDDRSGMGIMGGKLDQYTQFQVASSMPDAMSGEGGGGLAEAGVGAGIGMAIGNAIGGAMQGQKTPGGSGGEATIMVRCPECSELSPEKARFCASCGHQLIK